MTYHFEASVLLVTENKEDNTAKNSQKNGRLLDPLHSIIYWYWLVSRLCITIIESLIEKKTGKTEIEQQNSPKPSNIFRQFDYYTDTI